MRIKDEYAIAYKQVLEILKYVPRQDYKKIPKEKINIFREGAKKDYVFYYNPNKTLQGQNVSNITKVIISVLFRDYWASNEQKMRIIQRQKYERQRLEEKKSQKYNNILGNNKSLNIEEVEQQQEENSENSNTQLVEYKEDKWYKKIFSFIKKIFKR